MRKDELSEPAARHHLVGGFNRRVLMLAAGRRIIEDITHSPRDKPIGVYRATDLAVQLNAYYLNLCGALDNLAWAIQYEWQILPGITETEKGATKVGLFVRSFLTALSLSQPTLAKALEGHKTWHEELRRLRDPAAHRIPLYAIPGYLTEDSAKEYRRLESLGAEKGKAGDHQGMMELIHQASALGAYEPLMSIWTPSGERLVNAWDSIVRDHRQFQMVAQLVSTALFPRVRANTR